MRISEPSHLNNHMWYATLEAHDFPAWNLIARHADTCDVERPRAYAGTNPSPYLAAAVNALAPERLSRYLMLPRVARIDKRKAFTPGQMREYAIGEHFGFAPYEWEGFRTGLSDGSRGALNGLDPADRQHLAAYLLLRVREYKQYGATLGQVLEGVQAKIPNFLLSHRQVGDLVQFIGPAEAADRRSYDALFGRFQSQKPTWLSTEALAKLASCFSDAERAELLARGFAKDVAAAERIVAMRCELGVEGDVARLLAEMASMPAHLLDSLIG